MKEIEIQLGKKLRLHKVFTQVLNEKEMQTFSKSVSLFDSYIKSLGLKTRGPLITKTIGKIEDGLLKNEITLMIQLDGDCHQKLTYPYSFIDEFNSGKSLYAHFVGEETKCTVAKSKIEVIAYENELQLKGEIYNVFIDNKDSVMTLDVFAPIYEE